MTHTSTAQAEPTSSRLLNRTALIAESVAPLFGWRMRRSREIIGGGGLGVSGGHCSSAEVYVFVTPVGSAGGVILTEFLYAEALTQVCIFCGMRLVLVQVKSSQL